MHQLKKIVHGSKGHRKVFVMSIRAMGGIVTVALGLAAFVAAGAPSASASTIIYNFQIVGKGGNGATVVYTGNGAQNSVFASSGTTWNTANNGVTSAVDSNGKSSNVGFQIVDNGSYSSGSDAANNPDTLLGQYGYANNGSIGEITFSGLTANAAFTLDMYDINGGFADRTTKVSLANSSFTDIGTALTTTAGNDQTFNDPQNYVTFTGTTDASGNVYATFTGASTNEGDFNGAQIAVTPPAPEPSELGIIALMVVGMGGLLLKARRRYRADGISQI